MSINMIILSIKIYQKHAILNSNTCLEKDQYYNIKAMTSLMYLCIYIFIYVKPYNR